MSDKTFPDEMLMRFADGELDADEMAVIEKAMETDDDLVARVALFIETKAQAQAAMKPLLDEPVPEKLKAVVESMVAAKRAEDAQAETGPAGRPTTVVPFEARKTAARPAAAPGWTLPLAASIAAVIGGLAGYWAAGGAPRPGGLSVAGVVDAAIGEALETVPAGQEMALADGGRFRAIATFRDDAADLCREFELDSADRSTVVSVACNAGGEWRVSFAVAASGDTGGYAPASSVEALDAYLSAIEAGEPLSSEEEAAALAEVRR